MARRRRRQREQVKREVSKFSKIEHDLFHVSDMPTREDKPYHDRRRLQDDRRRFHPYRYAIPLLNDGRPARIKEIPTKKKFIGVYGRLSFKNPLKVEVCIRRKSRRLSLFRLGKIGKGKKVSPKRRWNEFSIIKC